VRSNADLLQIQTEVYTTLVIILTSHRDSNYRVCVINNTESLTRQMHAQVRCLTMTCGNQYCISANNYRYTKQQCRPDASATHETVRKAGTIDIPRFHPYLTQAGNNPGAKHATFSFIAKRSILVDRSKRRRNRC